MNDSIIAQVILQMFVLLLTAKVLGFLFKKINCPEVVGEFLAGLIWGPSFMKWMLPNIYNFIFPMKFENLDQTVMGIVTLFGFLTMLSLSGAEMSNFPRKLKWTISWHTLISLLTSIIFGYAILWLVPMVMIKPDIPLFHVGIFISICLMMSAVPIISRVLNDWGIASSKNGQFLLFSTIVVDFVGWILLSIGILITSFQSTKYSVLTITKNVFVMVLGVILLMLIGRILINIISRKKLNFLFWPAFLGFSVYTQFVTKINLYLGGLLFGLTIASIPQYRMKLKKGLSGFSNEVFTPLFFAMVGHHGNILIFKNTEILLFTVIFLIIGMIVKLIPSLILKYYKFSWNDLWMITLCLNARGGMEIFVATTGLSIGIFNNEMYTVLITTAILTAITCPLVMNMYMQKVKGKHKTTNQKSINLI
ncbi:cation:proton antiporter [Niallia sp. FSL M8-0099]